MISKTTLIKPFVLSLFFCLTYSFSNAQVLLAHYKFDNSLADENGEWDLVPLAGFTPTFDTGFDGTPNGAISGYGVNDYVETSTNFVLAGNDARSMTAWIRVDSFDRFNAILGLGVHPVATERWTFTIDNDGNPRVEVQGTGFTNEPDAVELGTWAHVATTYDSSSGVVKMYLNGEPGNSQAFPFLQTQPAPLRIGNDRQSQIPTRGITGALDEVRVYAGTLSDAEIKEIYDNSLLSVNEVSTVESFTAYPNPVTNRLYFSSNEVSQVEVYNLLGAKVLTEKVNDGVDTSSLDKGVYLVNCFNAQGTKIKTVKILK